MTKQPGFEVVNRLKRDYPLTWQLGVNAVINETPEMRPRMAAGLGREWHPSYGDAISRRLLMDAAAQRANPRTA